MDRILAAAKARRAAAYKAVKAARGGKYGTTSAKQLAYIRATTDQLRIENALKRRA